MKMKLPQIKKPKLRIKGLGKKLHGLFNVLLVTIMILSIVLPLVLTIVTVLTPQ